jgi:hypothetical protein
MTTLTLNPTADGHLDSAFPTTPGGSDTTEIIGNQFLFGDISRRMAIRFSLASLPTGVSIVSATLTLPNAGGAISTSATFYARRLTTTSWVEATTTWNTPWTTPGGDATTTDQATFTTSAAADLVFSIVPLVSDAKVNRSGQLDLLILGPESAGENRYITVKTRDNASQPTLVIVYGNGSHLSYTSQADQLHWRALA